jgi:DNA-binding response OmpR family regulator
MRILIIEDEKALARVIEVELLLQGMEVEIRGDGKSGLAAALDGGFDLILLDWMLPDIEGIEVCRVLRGRGSAVPIIMITAKQGVSNEVRGLQEGADDYIVKPFDMEQLLARIHAVSRRAVNPAAAAHKLCFRDLVLNTEDFTVHEGGRMVHLTRKEYEILHLLLSNPGKVFMKEDILSAVWGADVHLEEGVLAVHIKAIRDKFREDYICNVRGFGYLISRKGEQGPVRS